MTTKLTEKEIEERAERLFRSDVMCCDSGLVDMLLQRGDIDGFQYDDIEGLLTDPSDWEGERCREYLDDYGYDYPDDSPKEWDRSRMVEELQGVSIHCRDTDTDDVLRTACWANVDDETLDGLDKLRKAVNDNAEPAEVFEWWQVTQHLYGELICQGEPGIDNDYGCWWGRTCTGQGVLQDGTLQAIVRSWNTES